MKRLACKLVRLPRLVPVFEAIEYAFDDVARFVEAGVVFELHFAVFAGRNAGGRAGLVQPVA